MTYGILRGTGDILKACEKRGRDYLYVDHSYFWQHHGMPDNPSSDIYFRICKNGRYLTKGAPFGPERMAGLKIDMKPWKRGGDKVVIVPMSGFVASHMGIDPSAWLINTINALSVLTERQIVIKPKNKPSDFTPGTSPFIKFIQDAWAVVVAESNVAVDAILEGVPVFCSEHCAAAEVALTDLSMIESPAYPDRTEWLQKLSYQQFTFEEIRNGTARSITESY